MAATKDARLNLRLTPDDDELIRSAARAVGQSVTEFLSTAGLERAQEVLVDQRRFVLDDEVWDQFVALLDRPVQPDPRLVELFARLKRISREPG